jgi:hypothetical protein
MNYSAFISGTSLALLPTYSTDGTIVRDVVTVCSAYVLSTCGTAPRRTACMRVINMTVIYTLYKPAEEIYEKNMNTRPVDIANMSLHRPIAITSGITDSTVAEPGGTPQLTSQTVTRHNADRALTTVHISNFFNVTGHNISSIVYMHDPNYHFSVKFPINS